jgi:hypothetical protein
MGAVGGSTPGTHVTGDLMCIDTGAAVQLWVYDGHYNNRWMIVTLT